MVEAVSAAVPAVVPVVRESAIPAIQGSTDVSPFAGTQVQTSGVVTGVYSYVSSKGVNESGLYLQARRGDGNDATSDGLFVRTEDARRYAPGDVVTAAGTVAERYGMTTITDAQLTRIAKGVALPKASPLELVSDAAKAAKYLEAREGMRVELRNAVALGPTVDKGMFVATDFERHGPTKDDAAERPGQRITVGAELGVSTRVKSGDRISSVQGPLGFLYGEYRVQQTVENAKVEAGPNPPKQWGDVDGDDRIEATDVAAIQSAVGSAATGAFDPRDLNDDGKITKSDVSQAKARAARTTDAPTLSVASFNLENLFDTVDDPKIDNEIIPTRTEYEAKLGRIASTIRDTLQGAALIVVQEAENEDVLKDLIKRPELADLRYGQALLASPDRRGIDVGLLYRKDFASVEGIRLEQGRSDQKDKDGAARPLFARPPLVVDLKVRATKGGEEQPITLIGNHFMSKYGGGATDAWRIEQAKFVRDLVSSERKDHPDRPVIVAGDLNDHDQSAMMKVLTARNSPLRDLGQEFVPASERYTYNYKGASEAIDHILVTDDLVDRVATAGVRHTHADKPFLTADGAPAVASDHDLVYASFTA